MAQYVGEVIARISADVTGLRAGVAAANASLHSMTTVAATTGRSSAASLASIETQAQRTARRIDQLGIDFHKAASKAQSSVHQTTSSLESLNAGVNKVGVSVGHMGVKMASALLAASGLQAMGRSLMQAAKSAVIDYNSQVEQATIGFTTMLGSAEAANRELSSLEEFAARTPFEFTGLISATQRLLAFGFAIQEVRPALTSVGDFVAGIGGSMEMQGQQVIRALGQIRAKGRVQAEEMLQLTEAGVGAWQYLADAIGISTAEVMEQSRKGMISASQATSAILEGLSRDFGGMMEGQSKTLMGAMSTVKDYVRMTAGEMTKPIYEMTRDAVLKAANWLSSDKMQASANKMSAKIADGMDKVFDSIGEAAEKASPLFDAMREGLLSAAPAGSAVASTLGDILNVSLELVVGIASVIGQLNQFTAPIIVAGLKAIASTLGFLADAMEKNTWLVKLLAAAFVGMKLASFVGGIQKMVAGFMASFRASYAMSSAMRIQAAATIQAAAAQEVLNAAQGKGAASGIAGAAAAKGLTTRTTALGAKAGGAAKAVTGLGGSLAGMGVASGVGMAAMAGISIGLALMAVNAETTRKAIEGQVASAIKGADTVEEKMAGLEKALAGPMKSNRDLQYDGGFWSDMGAGLSNIVHVGDWFADDTTSESEKAYLDEMNKIQEEYSASQNNTYEEILNNARSFGDEYQLALAENTDGVNKELAKTLAAEVDGYKAMLDPMKMFGEQEQQSFDEMLTNMQDNNLRLGEWKSNLMYLMETGNEDLASFFATLGPSSLQAMNDMIQTGDFAGLRAAMEEGFALTGQDAEAALYEGLLKIPSMAEEVGIDVLGRLEKMAQDAAAPALELNSVYQETFDQLAAKSSETISKMFNGAELQDEELKTRIQEVADAFAGIDPKILVGAGLTAEALGIPDVQAALGLLAEKGVTDPLVISNNIADVLTSLDMSQDTIDGLIRPPTPFVINMDEQHLKTAADRANGLHSELLDMTQASWVVPIVVEWRHTEIGAAPTVAAKTWSGPGAPKPNLDLAYVEKEADGGILPRNARIQPPGTLIQWAEPETGGEAFIPLAPAKRERSLEIWKETGKRLDAFADGGIRFKSYENGGTNDGPGGTGIQRSPTGGVYYPSVPPPISPLGPKKSSGSGSKSSGGGGGGGGSGNPAADLWEIFKTMYDYGDQTDSSMLAQAKMRLENSVKYSDEWKEAFALLESTQSKISDDVAAVEAQAIQMDQWKVMVGEMSTAEYEAKLKERLDAAVKFTDEWAALWQEWEAVEQGHVYEQQSIEDNMAAVGDMSNRDYLAILEGRLAGLEQYSDEWTAVWRQIQGVNSDIESEAAAVSATFDGIADSIRDAFDKMYESVAGPMRSATSLISAFAAEEYIQFDQLLGFYDNVTEASQRWQDALTELAALGLNAESYSQLAESGPDALQLAEAIVAAGQDGVNQLNAAAANVAAITAQTATNYANNPAATNIETQIGTQLRVDNIKIDISGSSLTEGQVTTMIDTAFDELLTQVSLAS